jgi:DNA-binding NtrC family response regulator
VRQLSHVIERAVTLGDSDWIDVDDLRLDTCPGRGDCGCGSSVRQAGLQLAPSNL